MPYKRKRTAGPSSRRTRRPRKKSSGHPWLMIFFIFGLLLVSAYVTDRMTNQAGPKNLDSIAAVHQLFSDREEQGLVPREDRGTPESVKEKLKDAMDRILPAQKEERTEGTKKTSDPQKKEEEGSVFSLFSKMTGGDDKADSPEKSTESSSSSARKSAAGNASAPVSGKTGSAQAGTAVREKSSSAATGKLAVVIDDAGRDLESQHIYENLGIPMTLAVMPDQVHTREAAASWAAHGLPVIVHQPMESVSGVRMENKAILTSMTDWEISQIMKDSLSQVPEAVGINNHQGSKATADRRVMNEVMNVLHKRGMFFFDSRTNTVTEADAAAAAYGVPYARNNLFVDNSSDIADIEAMIREAANRAKANGTYIIIGHCRPNTAAAFRTMVPKLEAEGIRFVYLSSLLK
jgi:polysaccharide deacetylase 2 family uncharacterized protein YibQ